MSGFNNDLKIGCSAEKEVSELFSKKGYSFKFNTSKTVCELKKWDIEITKEDVVYKVEVKYDLMSSRTGNLAIELKCVLESEADYFVYKFNNEFWYTTRKNLTLEISREGRFVTGGDRGNSYMKLIKIEAFKQYSKQLN